MKKQKNIYEILGKRLRELRKERGMSQQKLADIVGYASFQSISNIENGRQPIKKDMAKNFARIFGVDENYFLDVDTEYPTKIEEYSAIINKSANENKLILNIISCLAELNDYEIEIQEIYQGGNVDEVFSRMRDYMIFKKDNKKIFALSLQDANTLGNIISDNFMTLIERVYQQ